MKNIFKSLLLYITIIIALSTAGCTKMAIFTDSTFPELSGRYHYYNYTTWANGLYEISDYESWDFDKTTKAVNFYNKWSYTEKGWTNALKESKSFDMEWKVENGRGGHFIPVLGGHFDRFFQLYVI